MKLFFFSHRNPFYSLFLMKVKENVSIASFQTKNEQVDDHGAHRPALILMQPFKIKIDPISKKNHDNTLF